MNERVILHCDINHCYAQIEEMKYPQLKSVPMAVGGYETTRHGIILAKNDLAKPFGIKTGDTLREAYEKCPELLIIPPNYEEYLYYSGKIKDIYREYSDRVESFGLDEAWVDISESITRDRSKEIISKEIQDRVYAQLGIHISIGISFNKIFAKLGSDMNKKAGLTFITKENYQDIVWKLDVGELLYVGYATKHKLQRIGIETIGDLANINTLDLKDRLGKMGEIIGMFARGEDTSQVARYIDDKSIKSVGNGITTPKDMVTIQDAKLVFYVLAESIASRLRDLHKKASTISIHLRDTNLSSFSRQMKTKEPLNLAHSIMEYVMKLLREHYQFFIPLRSITLSASDLCDESTTHQLSLFEDTKNMDQQRNLEMTIDHIRERYGFSKIKRCCMLCDEELTDFNPKSDHVIHPIGYFS